MRYSMQYKLWHIYELKTIKLTLNNYTNSLTFTNKLYNVVEEIKKRHNNVLPKKPKPYSLDQIRGALRLAWNKNNSLKGLSKKYLRRVPWILFEGETPFGGIKALVSEYLIWLNHNASASTIRTMITVFFLYYPKNLPTFELWRKGLKILLENNHLPSLMKWKQSCQIFSLLDVEGYKNFIRKFIESGYKSEEFLTETNFVGILENSKFLSCATNALLIHLKKAIENGKITSEAVSRCLYFLINNKNEIKFSEHRIDIVENLLSPFIPRINPDQQNLFTTIAKFLLKFFGDPRLPSSTKWHGVSLSTKQVILRWLTGITLEDFFHILDKTVIGGNYSHHWPYRRAFWLAYFKKGHITEAWVLLGNDAKEYVKRIKDWEFKSHGYLLKHSNIYRNHSVLLLKFKGGLILTEWSHSGKGRFWLPGNEKAPKFYKREYTRKELIDDCDFEFIHSFSDKYSWQRKVANWLEEQLGIFVPFAEYRVN